VINDRGEIATNAHVVTSGEGEQIKRAQEVYVKFSDDNQVPAKIVGFDPNADVALLRLETLEGLTLRPIPLGQGSDVRVGAPVIAIGSPFGEEQSLSVGVVSATDRAIRSLTRFDTLGAVQTDAAINQGNSGGPLINAEGEVIGINAQIRTSSGGGEGVGYAINVDQVRRSLDELRERGEVRYAYLGVSTTPVYPQLSERFKLGVEDGAWIQEIVPDGPADDADLKSGDGDVQFQRGPSSPAATSSSASASGRSTRRTTSGSRCSASGPARRSSSRSSATASGGRSR
jgi:S1-C subfamily serine protease